MREFYTRIRTDSPDTDPKHALSIVVKVCNDTASIKKLFSTLLVFGVDPWLPIKTKELPVQVGRLRALKAVRDGMTRGSTTDLIRAAITLNVPAAADAGIVEGNEVSTYRESPNRNGLRPYVISRRDGKKLVLNTGERFLDPFVDKVKPYYAAVRNMKQVRTYSMSNTSDKDITRKCNDEQITRLLDHVPPAADTNTNAIPADGFVVKIIKEIDERAKKQDFIDVMRAEVKG